MERELSAAERAVVSSWARGEGRADLRPMPEPERVLSGPWLREILSWSREELASCQEACALTETCAPAGGRGAAPSGSLGIVGARIEGLFRVPTLDRSLGGRLSIYFEGCTFDAPVDLCGAELFSAHLRSCRLPALLGASLELGADLDLSGSQLSGIDAHDSELGEIEECAVYLNGAEIGGRLRMSVHAGRRFEALRCVRLEGARIGGDLVLDGARLRGSGQAALDARAVRVGGDASLGPVDHVPFEAQGEVSFSAAQIGGDLILTSALLRNPSGRALHCEDLHVESVLMTSADERPFRAEGRVNCLSAVVGGNFVLSGARLAPGPDYAARVARGGPVCINFQQLRVSNALVVADVGALDLGNPEMQRLGPAERVRGWFLLSGAHARTLLDEEDGWPEAGYLVLEGLTYDRISERAGTEQARRRIEWLRLQFPGGRPTSETFRPQPYEELSQVLRRHGRREEADWIAVEQVRMRLRAKVDDPLRRAVPRLLLWISLHGYSSARAIGSFAGFIALGALLYSVALWGFDQPFVPVEHDPEPTRYQTAFGWLETQHDRGCPALVVPFFALDAAMPIIEIGQTSTCRFDPQGGWRWLWLLLHSTYSVLGAALSAVVVLTLSGVMRRDRT